MAYSGSYQGNRGNNSFGGRNDKMAKPMVPEREAVSLTSETYVDIAEKVIKDKIAKRQDGKPKLTTSKIRNILSMVLSIYDDVVHTNNDTLGQEIVEQIQYLRLRIAYEAGRDNDVKDFVQKSDLLEQVKLIKGSRTAYLLFCKYMEALVAYHKYYGGND